MAIHSARVCPVILAGGRGTRFWPLSRRARTKPFLNLGGGPSLLERAWARARMLAPPQDIFVAMESSLEGAVRAALPELAEANGIIEPEARDTGPAAVHAAWCVERDRPGALLALLPADHVVDSSERFVEAMEVACRTATEQDALVCLGVIPAGATTAYGYIECDGKLPAHAAATRVARFVEKPARARARQLVKSGRCLWNSGIFVWRAQVFLNEVAELSPELVAALERLRSGDAAGFFEVAPRVAVDRAVVERSRRVWVVGAEMGWDDVGDWNSLAGHLPADADGNMGAGAELALGARGCVVHSLGKPVVLVGVEDLVVVECDDVLLVARRDAAQHLREVPALLEAKGRRDLT